MARNLLGFSASGLGQRLVAGLSTMEPLEASALILEREIKTQLSRPGTGEAYRKAGETRRAAAAGAPPALQEGALLRSIGHRTLPRRRLRTRERIRVGTPEPYAPALEFGEVKRRVAAPHPFMRPALEAARGAMVEAFRVKMRATGTRELRRAAERRAARRVARGAA